MIETTQPDEAMSRLREALAAQSGCALRILVDPALADPVMPLYEEAGLRARRLSVPYGDVSAEIKPYVVTVDDIDAHESFVKETVSLAVRESLIARNEWPAARSVCAWLVMDDDDARALPYIFSLRALLLRPGHPGDRRLLRFWDPRVLPQLARIVGKSAWTCWVPAHATWLYIDSWGRMASYRFVKPEVAATQSWQPGERAWLALERVAEINHCLVMSGKLYQVASERVVDCFERLLLRASQLGCSRALDRATYAVLVDSMQLALEQHPRIAAMLARVRQEDVQLPDLLSVLEAEDWDGIRADLERGGHSITPSILAEA